MKRRLVFVLSLSVLLASGVVLVSACTRETGVSSKQPGSGIIEDVSTQAASNLIRANQNSPGFVILDVRTPSEFSGGHLKDAVNIDFYSATFQSDVGSRLAKDKTYLVYCATGVRSKGATGAMEKLGFKSVYNMLGGITQWQKEGLPTVK